MDSYTLDQFVRATLSQVRFSGLLLSIMIEKGLLTHEQARALIADVKQSLPPEHNFHEVYDALLREFP